VDREAGIVGDIAEHCEFLIMPRCAVMTANDRRRSQMDSTTFSAALSGALVVAAAAVTAGLTYSLTRRREREADWRKLKLANYSEYVAAMSGIVEGRKITSEAQARYTDAVNAMGLVASPDVLKALYAYLDENSYRSPARSLTRHDELLNELMSSMRQDINPSSRRKGDSLTFRLITDPPAPSNSPSP